MAGRLRAEGEPPQVYGECSFAKSIDWLVFCDLDWCMQHLI